MGRPWWPGGPPVWQQGGHPQNEGGPYRKRAAARAALRKRGGGPKGGPQGRQAGPGDAFCGAGGFSAGAMAAGCRITTGIDCDPTPLKLWAARGASMA